MPPNIPHRQSVPLFLPLVFLSVGIISSYLTEMSLWPIIIPATAAFVFILLKRHYIALLAIVAAAGATIATASFPKPLDPAFEDKEVTYSGIITTRNEKDRTTCTTVLIDSVAGNDGHMHECRDFKSDIYFFDSHDWLTTGHRVIFTSRLSAPVYDPDLPDNADLSTYYLCNGISATGVVFSNQSSRGTGDSRWRVFLDNIRTHLTDKIFRSGVSYDCAAFLEAILLGDDNHLDRELRENFSQAGLSHILALSGTHVAVIAGLLSMLLYPLHFIGYRKAALILSVILLWGYALITGLSASVVRSVVMASVVILSLLADRSKNPLNALCLAGILILCVRPTELFSAGMQMSFMAVASILLLANALNPVSQRKRAVYNIVGIFATIIAAVAGTWIIANHYFHYTPLWFLPANVPMVFLVPLEISAGAVMILSESIGLHLPWVSSVVQLAYDAISWIAAATAMLPHAGIRDMYLNPWCIPIYFIALWIVSEALRKRSLPLAAFAISLFAAVWGISLLPYGDDVVDNLWYVTRNESSSDIVVYTGGNILMTTTAWRESTEESVGRFCSSNAGFLSRRGITSPLPLGDNSSLKNRDRQVLALGRKTLAIAGEAQDTTKFMALLHSDYTLITRNSQYMKADAIMRHYNPDTVIIAREVFPSHHDRLMTELQETGVPCISLRDGGIFSRLLER